MPDTLPVSGELLNRIHGMIVLQIPEASARLKVYQALAALDRCLEAECPTSSQS